MSERDPHPIPYDPDIEEQTLASVLVAPEVIGEIAGTLLPDHFYNSGYRKVYAAALERWEVDMESVNLVDMLPTLEKHGVDYSRMLAVAESMATHWDIKQRAERMIQLATLRDAMKAGQQLISNAHSWPTMDQADIQKLVSDGQQLLEKISERNVRNVTTRSVKDIVMDFAKQVGDAMDGIKQDVTSAGKIPTKLIDLDRLIGGVAEQELIILAARPSMGKTAFMNQLALNASEGSAGPVAIFSLEMTAQKLVARMITNLGNLSGLDGKLSDDDYLKFTMAASELAQRNIVIDDEPGQTVAKIKAKARRLQQEQGLSMIMVDYLQFIEPPASSRGMSRADIVSANVKALKNMGRELKVPVVALAQVGRQVEQRADKRPMMSDLRESGEIEQTADKIMFLYRDDYYDKESAKKNIVEVDVAKHRDGATGKVELAFLKEYGKFINLSERVDGDGNAEQMACV